MNDEIGKPGSEGAKGRPGTSGAAGAGGVGGVGGEGGTTGGMGGGGGEGGDVTTANIPKRFYLVWAISYAILFFGVIGLYIDASNHGEDQRNAIKAEQVRADLRICLENNEDKKNFSDFMTGLIVASDKAIDSIQYYQDNPDEATRVHAENAQAISDLREKFRDDPCEEIAEGRE